jgi:thioredoxin-like negative regulator of GroEL
VDIGGTVAEGLNVQTFPAAVVFANGSVAAAQTLPSYRQLQRLLKDGVEDAEQLEQETRQ